MSVTKFLGTFLQATLFGGTYDDVAFEVRVLKGEVARLHDRLDKELDRLHARLDEVGAGQGGGAKGKSRLRIMSSAEAADVAADKKVEAAPQADAAPEAVPPQVAPAAHAGGLQVATDSPFRPDMTILAAWNAHPEAPGVFAKHHLPGCVDCPLSATETLADGAALHSLDAAALLADLERLVTA